MFLWFIRFHEFPEIAEFNEMLHLGKTPMLSFWDRITFTLSVEQTKPEATKDKRIDDICYGIDAIYRQKRVIYVYNEAFSTLKCKYPTIAE